jgi:hypothetical protein
MEYDSLEGMKLRRLAFLAAVAAVTIAVIACESELTCSDGEEDCGGVCKSLEADVFNCGACGHACPVEQICSRRECVKDTPPPPRRDAQAEDADAAPDAP